MSNLNKVLLKGRKALSSDASKITGKSSEVESDVELKSLMREVILDEEIRGFFSDITDAIVTAGYHLEGTGAKKNTKVLKETRFDKELKKIYWNGLTYETIFIEPLKKVSGEFDGIKVIDTSELEPKLNKFGDIEGWIQKATNGEEINFNKDEIIVIKVDQVTSGFWTVPVVRTLARLIRLKKYILEHLEFLYKTNQFKTGIHFKNVDEDSIELLTDMIKQQVNEREKMLITVSEDDITKNILSEPKDLQWHLEVLNMIRNKMLTLIRVPPIIAGTVDNSNRSSSDVQARFQFKNRISAFLKDLEDEINYELLPKIGMKNTELYHNDIDIKDEKEYIDMATSLIQAGAKKDLIVDWINERTGMNLPSDLFPTEEVIGTEVKKQSLLSKLNPFKSSDSTRVPKQNSNQFPSRKPKERDSSNINFNSENHNDK